MPHIRVIDGQPQINVKDHTLWASDLRTAEMIAQLGENRVEAIYDGVREDFWSDIAPDIADEYGYGRDIWADGRSGGWLYAKGARDTWSNVLDCVDGDPLSPITDLDTLRELNTDAEMGVCNFDEDETKEAIAAFDRFKSFAYAIEGAVKATGEMFVQRLCEAYTELKQARESAIARSEN